MLIITAKNLPFLLYEHIVNALRFVGEEKPFRNACCMFICWWQSCKLVLMWFARLPCLYVSYACISGLIVTCISVMSLYKYMFICRFSSKCTDLFENGALCIVCFYWHVESVKSTCEITSRCISINQVLQTELISIEIWNQNLSCCHLAENRKVLVMITFV